MKYQRCEGSADYGSDSHTTGGEGDAVDNLCPACRKTLQEAEAVRPTSWELFALQREDHFEHFYPSSYLVRSCGRNEPVFRVRLTIDPDGPYWGWYYSAHPGNASRKGSVSMIYRFSQAVDVCFGSSQEVQRVTSRGMGEVVRLRADAIRPAEGDEVI